MTFLTDTLEPNPKQRASLDPITIELIRNAFLSICEEMARSLIRSSHSPNIKERRDCSCCLYSERGEVAVQAEHIPVHLGVMPYALQHILKQYSPEYMRSGDTYIVNDPYFGGNHLPDLIVAGPLFFKGKLVGFAASMAHHNDVGGLAPRSMPATAVEIFQEGLRIPPIKLSEDWIVNDDIFRLIAVNSRTPEERHADLRAQVATVRLAQRRLDELGQRYSVDMIMGAIEEIMSRSEAATRVFISKLPDEEWVGESSADFGGRLVPIRVRIYKCGSELVFDFAGTASETRSPFNSCLSNTYACVFMALRVSIIQDIPPNGGLYRALRINVPPGTILNPQYPAAVSAATQVSYHTFEALMRALAPLAPDSVIADSGGGGVFSFGGKDPRTGNLFAYGEALGGGAGADAHSDGESAVMPPISNLHDTPVEALEMTLPIQIPRYELVNGSAGIGRNRGGLGFRRAYRMLVPVRCSFQISMGSRAPIGLAGGGSGRPTRITIVHENSETSITAFSEYEASAGDTIVIETAGGGGFGASSERLPAQAASDAQNGYN
jgi:N-methylhydantoinase B